MAVQNKALGTYACYAFMILCCLYVVGMIVVPWVLFKAQEGAHNHKERDGEFRNERERERHRDLEKTQETFVLFCCTIWIIYLLVVLVLRLFATWKLWNSLKLYQQKPREALKSVETTLNVEVAIGVCSGCTLVFVPFSFFEIIFIYFLVSKYRDGLQIEVDRLEPEQGMLMMGSSGDGPAPMMMAPQGNGAPWPVTSSEIYPTPTPN